MHHLRTKLDKHYQDGLTRNAVVPYRVLLPANVHTHGLGRRESSCVHNDRLAADVTLVCQPRA